MKFLVVLTALFLFQGAKNRQSNGRGQGPNISLHLTHQNVIRAKYSSPGSTSDDNDPGQSDDQASSNVQEQDDGFAKADMLPLATPERSGSGRSQRSRSSLFERSGGSKGFFPPKPNNMYSTSASDSEEAPTADGTLTRASASRSSVVSSSSTLTLKSTGSSAFRRNRGRSSVTSTKSSASDKTLTGDVNVEAEQYCLDSQDGNTNQAKGDTKVPSSGKNEKRENKKDMKTVATSDVADPDTSVDADYKSNHGDLWSADDELESVSHGQNGQSLLLDPTVLARKVLAETRQERMALEHMQRLSIHTLQEKQNGTDIDVSSDADIQTSTSGVGSLLSSPQTSSSAIKPVGCVAPSVQSTTSVTAPSSVPVNDQPVKNLEKIKKSDSRLVSGLSTEPPTEEVNKVARSSFRQPVSVMKNQESTAPSSNSTSGVSPKVKPPIPVKPKSVKFSDIVQENALTPEPEVSAGETSCSSLDTSTEPYKVPVSERHVSGSRTHQGEPAVYSKVGGPIVRTTAAQVNRVNPQCQVVVASSIGSTPVSVSSSHRTNIVQYSMNAQSEPVKAQAMVSSNLPSKSLLGHKAGSPGSAVSRLQAGRMGAKMKLSEAEETSCDVSQGKLPSVTSSSSTTSTSRPPGVQAQTDLPPGGAILTDADLKDPVINISGFERYTSPQGYKPPPPYPGPKMPGGAARPASLASTSSLYSSPSSNSPGVTGQSSVSPPWYDSKSSDSEMSAVLESPSSEKANQRPGFCTPYNEQTSMPARKYSLPTYSTGRPEATNERGVYMQGAPVTYPNTGYGQDKVSLQNTQNNAGIQNQQTSVYTGRGYIQNNFSSVNTVEIVSAPEAPGYASSESDVYGSNSTISLPPPPATPPGGSNTQMNRNGRESPIYENIKWFADIAKQVGYGGSRHSQSPVSSTSIHSQSSSFSSTGYPAPTPQYTTQSKPPPYNHAIYSRQQPVSYSRSQTPKSPPQTHPNPYPQSRGPLPYPNQPSVQAHKPAYELPNQRPGNYGLPGQRLPNYEPTNVTQGYFDPTNQRPAHMDPPMQPAHYDPPNQRHVYPQSFNQNRDNVQLANQRPIYAQVSNQKPGHLEVASQQKGQFEQANQRPPPYNKVLEHLTQHGRPAIIMEDPLTQTHLGQQSQQHCYRQNVNSSQGYGNPVMSSSNGHGYRSNGLVANSSRGQLVHPGPPYSNQYTQNPRAYPSQNGLGDSSGDSFQSSDVSGDQQGGEGYTMLQSSKC